MKAVRLVILGGLLFLVAACGTHMEDVCTDYGDPFGLSDSVMTVNTSVCLNYNEPRLPTH
jgi:hypothetical protein